MRPTFDSTVKILVDAYMRDELAHSFCSACAVGNLVAHALGTKPGKSKQPAQAEFDCWQFDNGVYADWYELMDTGKILSEKTKENGLRQIQATGYTFLEIYRIENAFEKAPGKPDEPGVWLGKQTDPVWMFNGLMAVVDVLAEIHGIDLKQREEAKLLFQK